jgi:hypothetical protein
MNIETILHETWSLTNSAKKGKQDDMRVHWKDRRGTCKSMIYSYGKKTEVEVKSNWIGIGDKENFYRRHQESFEEKQKCGLYESLLLQDGI